MSPSQAHLTLINLCRADTFRVFIVRLEDRQEFEIESPLQVALPANPSAGTFVVYCRDEMHIIGLDSIVSIDVAR
jgi:hypothetical protein